jgi:hypothetical protein
MAQRHILEILIGMYVFNLELLNSYLTPKHSILMESLLIEGGWAGGV